MDKYFEQFKNLEICDFRINEVFFENFRGFENKNKISFATNSKIPETGASEEINWVKTKPKKYLKIIGIYGKNASGKTTTIDALLQIHDFLNVTTLSNVGLRSQPYLRRDFIGNLDEFTLFNDKKPGILSLSISSLEIDFVYKLIIEKNKPTVNNYLKKTSSLDINEVIEVMRFKGVGENLNKEIWNSKTYNEIDRNVTNKLYFLQYRVVDAKETDVMENNLRKYKNNLSDPNPNVTVAYEKAVSAFNVFEKLLDDKKYEKAVERILGSFLGSIIPFDVWNSNGRSSEILIAETLARMIREFGITIQDINKLLTVAATAIDKNIENVYFTIKTQNQKLPQNFPPEFAPPIPPMMREIYTLKAKMKNGKELPFSLLSSGVLNFIYQFCLIYSSSVLVPKQIHKYILIDELGTNWHSFMSKQFINIFKNNIIENCTLIFTSHNPQLADGLRNDSIYIIDNEREIIRLSDTKIRNSEKFSNKYANPNIDWFDSNPSLDDFDNLIDFLDSGNG